MKRRQLLRTTTLAGAGITAAACGQQTQFFRPTTQQVSRPRVEWRMATSWPRSLDVAFGAAETIATKVSELTGGRFTISLFEAGELAPPLQVLDAVQRGSVECGHTAGYYYVNKSPAFAFSTTVPFGFNAQQQNAWLYDSGRELLQGLYADFNIISFPAGNTSAQMGGWFKRQIQTPDDLKGLKMRMPGLGGAVMGRLGVTVQNLPGSELLAAFQQGTIEAAEWVGPHDDEQLGLNTVAQYYYYPGWHEPGTGYELQINQRAWERLPLEYQEAVKVAASEANFSMLARYDAANRLAMQRLLKSGVILTPWSPEILQAARTAAFELYEETASQDATYRQIYTQWKTFRAELFQWHQFNELGYASFAFQS